MYLLKQTTKLKGEIMKLSKITLNMASRYNVELCDSINNELHIIVDPENNDCACVAYVLEGGKYHLSNVWDHSADYPEVLENEKAIRNLIKLITK